MTIKERKKQIRQAYFSTGGMIVISILGIVGLFLFLFSGILNIYDYESFYNCFSKNGMTIIFGGFFIVISILTSYYILTLKPLKNRYFQ